MRKWIPQFWYSPTKRYRIAIIGFIACIASFYGLLSIDIHSHLYIYLTLAFTALISFFLVFTFYTFSQLKEIGQDFHSFLKISERNAVHDYYQLKHQDKIYKGPNWEDEEFKKIPDLKRRVDAFVKTSIDYQQIDFKHWKKRNVGINLDTRSQTIFRSFWILCATTISIIFLYYLGWFEYLSADNLKSLGDTSRGFFTIPVALIGTIVAAPIIFMVWLFRDKNNRIQIENTRKDTNLKDFQKLSEWASGFHLPENKYTKTIKNELKKDDLTNDTKKEFKEEIQSIECFVTTDDSNSISRRQGAEALQASAIAQLEAFMFGKYGEQFMQPAFLLIHAIWESIITQQQLRFPDDKEFNNSLNNLHKNPIIAALNRALAGADGKHLRLFEKNLKGLNLTGLDTDQPLLETISLTNMNLENINFSYAKLNGTSMQGSNLTKSNLRHANLESTNLQQANFKSSTLILAKFRRSQLQYADLENADLTGATLYLSNLEYANLQWTIMHQCKLTGARLHGAKLQNADFTNADFKNTKINQYTIFDDSIRNNNKIREDILLRGATWDDNPEWLTDKLKSKILLKEIIEDCNFRKSLFVEN